MPCSSISRLSRSGKPPPRSTDSMILLDEVQMSGKRCGAVSTDSLFRIVHECFATLDTEVRKESVGMVRIPFSRGNRRDELSSRTRNLVTLAPLEELHLLIAIGSNGRYRMQSRIDAQARRSASPLRSGGLSFRFEQFSKSPGTNYGGGAPADLIGARMRNFHDAQRSTNAPPVRSRIPFTKISRARTHPICNRMAFWRGTPWPGTVTM